MNAGGEPGKPGEPGHPGLPGTEGGGEGGRGGAGGMGGSGGRGVSLEEHALLLYRTTSLEEDLKDLRGAFNKVIWLLIATVFTITGALIIAALVSLSTQGRLG